MHGLKIYKGVMCNDTALKNDEKFKEELFYRFKIGIKYLTNSDPSSLKSQNFAH